MEQRAFKFYNIIPFSPGKEKEQAENVIALEKETGIDIALYCLSLHPEGVPADRKVDSRIDSYRKFRDALTGSRIKTGILLQSILGHWPQLDEIREAWTTTVDIEGNTPRFCPLDENFRKYIFRTAALLAREKPCLIMGDDDIRSSSPHSECFCALHTAEFNRRTGNCFTPEEYRLAVKNCKVDDEVFSAYWQLRQDTVDGVCKLIRLAIDSVDPSIPAGTCMPDWEQKFNGSASRAIAAKGQKPLMRIANGKFVEESIVDLPHNHLRSQALRDFWQEIPQVLDEADTFPHSLFSKSAISMHAKLCSSIFAGLNGAKIWYVNCNADNLTINRKYTWILKKYAAFYQNLTGILSNSQKAGIIIPLHRNFIQWHPGNTRENFLSAGNWSDKYLGIYGIPFRGSFSFNEDGIYALAGKNAIDRLSDEELIRIFHHKVLLDGGAAQALTGRGLSTLTGVRAEECSSGGNWEISVENKERYRLFRSCNIPFFSLTDQNARVITELAREEFNVPGNVVTVSPCTVICDNSFGGRVCTTAFRHDTVFANVQEKRKKWLLDILEMLNGRMLSFTAADNQHIMLLHRELPTGTDIVGMFNLGFDPLDAIRLRCGKTVRQAAFLRSDGVWQPLEFEFNNNILSLPLTLQCCENVILKID